MRSMGFLALTALVACGGDTEDTASTAETGATETNPGVYDEELIVGMIEGHIGPLITFWTVGGIATSGTPDGCPAVETSGYDMTVTGGCTDNFGNSFEGTVVFDSSSDGSGTVTYSNWSMTEGGNTFTADGVSTIDSFATMTSNLTTTGNIRGFSSAKPTLTYVDYKQTNIDVIINQAHGSMKISGEMTVEGVDSFEVDASHDEAGACDASPDSFSAEMTGVGTITLEMNLGDECDNCIAWVNGDQSGEYCL